MFWAACPQTTHVKQGSKTNWRVLSHFPMCLKLKINKRGKTHRSSLIRHKQFAGGKISCVHTFFGDSYLFVWSYLLYLVVWSLVLNSLHFGIIWRDLKYQCLGLISKDADLIGLAVGSLGMSISLGESNVHARNVGYRPGFIRGCYDIWSI